MKGGDESLFDENARSVLCGCGRGRLHAPDGQAAARLLGRAPPHSLVVLPAAPCRPHSLMVLPAALYYARSRVPIALYHS